MERRSALTSESPGYAQEEERGRLIMRSTKFDERALRTYVTTYGRYDRDVRVANSYTRSCPSESIAYSVGSNEPRVVQYVSRMLGQVSGSTASAGPRRARRARLVHDYCISSSPGVGRAASWKATGVMNLCGRRLPRDALRERLLRLLFGPVYLRLEVAEAEEVGLRPWSAHDAEQVRRVVEAVA